MDNSQASLPKNEYFEFGNFSNRKSIVFLNMLTAQGLKPTVGACLRFIARMKAVAIVVLPTSVPLPITQIIFGALDIDI